MKNIWLKNKLYIIIFVFVLIFSGVVYFLVFSLIDKMKITSNQIQENLIDQKIEDERLGGLAQMEKDWQEYDAQKNLLDSILSPGNEISFIESIDSIAQNSGNIIDLKIGDQVDPIEIAKIKTSTKKNKREKGIMDEISYSNYFPMQINLRGNYPSLINFIHMLENGHFYVNIISINFKKVTINNDSSEIETNMFSQQNKEKKDDTSEIIITRINAIVYTQKQ